ncbi:MAG: hypothetical protein ACXWMN_08240 [Candidatus Limnocylindria bacterium]
MNATAARWTNVWDEVTVVVVAEAAVAAKPGEGPLDAPQRLERGRTSGFLRDVA